MPPRRLPAKPPIRPVSDLAAMRRAVFVTLVTVALVGCAGDGRSLQEPAFAPPPPEAVVIEPGASVAPATDVLTPPSALSAAPSTVARAIEFDRLFSPANATAEVDGTGALPGDSITVDDEPADVISFDVHDDGFVARIRIDDEGAHTVCIADTCGRVFTLAADAESPDEVIAQIEEALLSVQDIVDYPAEFPEWTVEIGGPFSGTGGTTDAASKTVTIHRNRGRSIDEFVRTILHEFGHIADTERLDDAARAAYLTIRGIDPKVEWLDETSHRLDQWARQPGEDFAETMVMFWSGGRWEPRTMVDQPPPTETQLAEIAALVDAD